MALLGTPTEAELGFITSKRAVAFIRSLPISPPINWQQQFPAASPQALDLLSRMLQFDPRKRITVAEALDHPYLAALIGGDEAEPSAPGIFRFDFKEEQLTSEAQVKDCILREVRLQKQASGAAAVRAAYALQLGAQQASPAPVVRSHSHGQPPRQPSQEMYSPLGSRGMATASG